MKITETSTNAEVYEDKLKILKNRCFNSSLSINTGLTDLVEEAVKRAFDVSPLIRNDVVFITHFSTIKKIRNKTYCLSLEKSGNTVLYSMETQTIHSRNLLSSFVCVCEKTSD